MKIKLFAFILLAAVVGFGACGGGGGDDKSSEKKILTFVVNGASYSVNEPNHTITHTYAKTGAGQWPNLPIGSVVPQITISNKATINPPATTAQNFVDNTVTYTVTAEDGSTQVYTVKADKQLQ